MRVAIFGDLTDQTMPILDFAQEVEDRGFSGLFLNEHTHIPINHGTSSFPGGGATPERYARFWDPFIALSFVAAQTSLEIGTSVALIGEHDPIQLAHAVATLDTLSGGCFTFGVGWGWNREEFADHGRPPHRRAAVVEEWVGVMTALWTQDEASYEGEFVHLSPSRSWPKPVQRPRPPILLGAPPSDRNFARVAAWCDGWITMGQDVLTPEFACDLRRLRHAWENAERDPEQLRVHVIYNPLKGAAPLDSTVGRCRELGVTGLLYHVFDGETDRMLRRLDRAVPALDC